MLRVVPAKAGTYTRWPSDLARNVEPPGIIASAVVMGPRLRGDDIQSPEQVEERIGRLLRRGLRTRLLLDLLLRRELLRRTRRGLFWRGAFLRGRRRCRFGRLGLRADD